MSEIVTFAVPALTPDVGVKSAVRVSGLPVVLSAPKVPPVTTKSPLVPFQTKLVPGSSLKVNVMVAVWPEINALVLLVTVAVGRVVSTKYLPLSATAKDVMLLLLPEASFKVPPFRLSASALRATPLVSFCPLATVDVKTKALLPEPDT